MVGAAWRSLAEDLERELRNLDPSAVVHPTVDASGLLRLKVFSEVLNRRETAAIARRWQEKAATMCECCGEPVSAVRVAGLGVVTVVCPDCDQPVAAASGSERSP